MQTNKHYELYKQHEIDASKNNYGFAHQLTVAFIVLKLCSVIDWSWIWVVAPMWIKLIINIIIGIFSVNEDADQD